MLKNFFPKIVPFMR